MIGDVSEVSEEEEELIREQYDKVKAKASHRSRGPPSLHLPDGEDTLCDGIRGSLRTKSFEVYPPGYFEICRSCAAHWRKQNE